MQLSEYQNQAMSYRLQSANKEYALLGLAGEVGELYSLVAKSIRDSNRMFSVTAVKKELGDILWFVAAIATDYGFGLDEIAQVNLDKLSSRQERNKLQGSGDER